MSLGPSRLIPGQSVLTDIKKLYLAFCVCFTLHCKSYNCYLIWYQIIFLLFKIFYPKCVLQRAGYINVFSFLFWKNSSLCGGEFFRFELACQTQIVICVMLLYFCVHLWTYFFSQWTKAELRFLFSNLKFLIVVYCRFLPVPLRQMQFAFNTEVNGEMCFCECESAAASFSIGF